MATSKPPGKPRAPKRKPARKQQSDEAAPGDRVLAASESILGDRFARTIAPRELSDPEKRKKWGLPSLDETDKRGQYIVELNAGHIGGLPGATSAFLKLYNEVIEVPDASHSPPLFIAKSYYRCEFTDHEWRTLVSSDEARPKRERAIYRLWPDFPVEAQMDRSIATIKADAALRSFDAGGEDIVWAVIDSGVQALHPHFGPHPANGSNANHLLLAEDVIGLHRCFADVVEIVRDIPVNRGPLENPDSDPAMPAAQREALLEKHRKHALNDEFGHGTHVAGIIAGQCPNQVDVCVFERQYKINEDGTNVERNFAVRTLSNAVSLRGVAPRCKLISLRVLDRNGKGRASQLIQALEYLSDRINDNPKLMRVHGVNLSVGYEFDAEMFACGQSPLCIAVNRLVQGGVVVVAAAGNTGFGAVAADVGATKVGLSNTINDPGNAAFAITVGSTHREAPHTYGVSYFSSKGPTADGRLKPDIVAPGERVTSCAAGAKLGNAQRGTGITAGIQAYYIDDSGTSMAAPHVSGAIAAFLSIRREFVGKPLEVKRIFLDSATPLGRERYFEGNGLVDLMRAIQSV